MKLLGTTILGVVALLGVRYAIQEGFRGAVASITSDHAAACLSLSGSTTAVILAYARGVQPGETRKFKSSTHIHKNAIFHFDGISGF